MSSSKQEPMPAFQGSFHFVHHDESNMKALPHRKAVFTHVQNNYRAWRTKTKLEQLRASTKVPRDPRVQIVRISPGSEKGDIREEDATSERPVTANISKKRSPIQRQGFFETHSPQTVVKEGQSDPFNAYPLKVDARVNQVMSFYRDQVMPLLFDGPAFEAGKRLNWKIMVEAFEKPGAAYCHLARNAVAAAIVAPSTELAKQTFLYQARATKSLREDLVHEGEILSIAMIRRMFALFDAEVMAQNLPGALAHGTMIVRSYEAQSKQGPVDLMTLTSCLFADMNLSCMYLRRPLFDCRDWLPRMYQPMFTMTEATLPHLPSIPIKPLDPSIRDPKLVTIFRQRRQSDYIRKLMFTSSKTELPLTTTVWITIRSMLHLSQLINTYLDYQDLLAHSLLGVQEAHVQAYLSLAAVFYLRFTRYNKLLHGVRLYDRGAAMATHLRAMITAELRCPDFAAATFDNARLWALFVGALGEQMPLRDRPEPSTAWFNVNFAAMARRLGLLSWASVRPRLELFLYEDSLPPHASGWFFETMGKSFEGAGVEELVIVPCVEETVAF